MKKLLALSALAFAATPAIAIEQPYIALDYLQAEYDRSASPTSAAYSASPGAARLRMGSDLSKYLGAEAHITVGTSDDEALVAGISHAIKIDSMYTVGLTARLPLGGARIYAFGGYSYLQVSAQTKETNDDGVSYGVGAAIPIGGTWLVEVDYTAYIDKDAYSLTGLGLGLRRPL